MTEIGTVISKPGTPSILDRLREAKEGTVVAGSFLKQWRTTDLLIEEGPVDAECKWEIHSLFHESGLALDNLLGYPRLMPRKPTYTGQPRHPIEYESPVTHVMDDESHDIDMDDANEPPYDPRQELVDPQPQPAPSQSTGPTNVQNCKSK
jgi:hypothetical protein